MSAYRQAMLSVAPERLEQFSILMKQDINDKDKKKKSKHTSSRNSSSRKPKKSSKSSSSSSKHKSSSSKDRKRKSSRDRQKSKEKQQKKSEQDENLTDISDMEENGLDLKKEIHSLGFYVKDRPALIDQIFSIIKGPKLLSMFPDNNQNVEDMKQKCLAQLEVMSSKRILKVISGENLNFSSGTDSSDDESKIKVKENSLQTNFVDSTTSSSVCDVIMTPSKDPPERISPDCEVVSSSKPETKDKLNRRKVLVKKTTSKFDPNDDVINLSDSDVIVIEDKQDEVVVVTEEEEIIEVEEDVEYTEMVDAMLEETLAPKPQIEDKKLTQLEVLELEMRARAIKSLMSVAKRS